MKTIIRILISILIFLAGGVIADHINSQGYHLWLLVWVFFIAWLLVLVDFCITIHYRSISGGSS